MYTQSKVPQFTLRVNKRLAEKVTSLKEEVSSLKDAIKELECVSVVEQHL